ncbi:MAG: hypothetical protein BRC29_02580 [Nanohaloarchaea archaeon SW_7_43_1]|nr:MAG: hypothetical protein BRC29_02580 [Nanohaloarchaea archaeon SW_7_43_1]
MTDKTFFLVGYDYLNVESFTYFADNLGESNEIIMPENSIEKRLAQSGGDVLKYENENETIYRTDTKEGELFYGTEQNIRDIFPNSDAWGEFLGQDEVEQILE